jgi:aspartate/methionine/tyrosine aminotransferase
MKQMPFISDVMDSLPVYTSKAISAAVKADPAIVNLAIGEPEFGPPQHLLASIQDACLNLDAFTASVKSYEQSRGMLSLRLAVSDWYRRRHGLAVDPDTEVLITHGGVEAIALAILSTSNPSDTIIITDPSYMLYAPSAHALGRRPLTLIRRPDTEYLGMINEFNNAQASPTTPRAIIVNSPENPTGYVIDLPEWKSLATFADEHNLWVIHDEVYDTMTFSRAHLPARCINGLKDRAILINSCSKKFGVPGLRVGWLCAPADIISRAAKLHDYLFLGVNILYEQVAQILIQDQLSTDWLQAHAGGLATRVAQTLGELTEIQGFAWERRPLGAMFAFPNVAQLAVLVTNSKEEGNRSSGEIVAEYLLRQHKIAVIPGSTYGSQGNDCIRFVLCTGETCFREGLNRLKAASERLVAIRSL